MGHYEGQIFDVLRKESAENPYTGRIVVLIPFMEKNGYFDGNGLWIKKISIERF